MLTVGDAFPVFSSKACVGNTPDDLITIDNSSDGDKWRVFFFYPKDFTFVCPTEIAEFGRRLSEFHDRDCTVFGGSTDNEFSHLAWRNSHEDLRDLPYPLIAAQKLATELGILDAEEGVCLRATFIVDPHGVIQWAQANNLSVGRNVNEVLRVLDAIQSDELCPCNWSKGDGFIQV
ncbi:Alkyl hydroperoxide reductase subunit C [Poriferisphaera corsica]|uniref:Alkyl hydroperoxide reductase C n=1 Tax=Poriferisphaera corsica TaxID=2528020 RepID=A0A517YR96_9BACT|nr:peroxiredoxin [Poriferisphaera corsica]QDU32747.1 Alkyl hydroperoxide reductase subunit C [Poriferisphaera corsica]